jgi:hypothetical protein
MQKLITVLLCNCMLIACDDRSNGVWNEQNESTVTEVKFDQQPKGDGSWELSPLCTLYVFGLKGNYIEKDDLFPLNEGIQIRVTVIPALDSKLPDKVSLYFNGELAGYTGEVAGIYSNVVTLPNTNFALLTVEADGCESTMFLSTIEQ